MGESTIESRCFVCGVKRLSHQMGEENGSIDHPWQADREGQERPQRTLRDALEDKVEQVGEQVAKPPVVVMVTPAPDLALRRFLVERGLLTEADLAILKGRDVAPQIPRDLL